MTSALSRTQVLPSGTASLEWFLCWLIKSSQQLHQAWRTIGILVEETEKRRPHSQNPNSLDLKSDLRFFLLEQTTYCLGDTLQVRQPQLRSPILGSIQDFKLQT